MKFKIWFRDHFDKHGPDENHCEFYDTNYVKNAIRTFAREMRNYDDDEMYDVIVQYENGNFEIFNVDIETVTNVDITGGDPYEVKEPTDE